MIKGPRMTSSPTHCAGLLILRHDGFKESASSLYIKLRLGLPAEYSDEGAAAAMLMCEDAGPHTNA